MSPTDFSGKHITVAGLGVSGISAARALAGLGARVTVVDGGDDEALRRRAETRAAGVVTLRRGDATTQPRGTPQVLTTPSRRPHS
ncbi:UDP-N-acetylmuramoyl-L-alanine--D-glutamate ligase, partial [Streptomyces sp. NPDC049577]